MQNVRMELTASWQKDSKQCLPFEANRKGEDNRFRNTHKYERMDQESTKSNLHYHSFKKLVTDTYYITASYYTKELQTNEKHQAFLLTPQRCKHKKSKDLSTHVHIKLHHLWVNCITVDHIVNS